MTQMQRSKVLWGSEWIDIREAAERLDKMQREREAADNPPEETEDEE